MGTNQTSNCCSTNSFLDIDNSVEAQLRESIEINSDNIKRYSDIISISLKLFHIHLLDIECIPLEWITKETYCSFIGSIFKNAPSSKSKISYKDIALNYDDVNVSNRKYKERFHLLLLMWVLYLVKLDRKDKVQVIKEIIVKVNKVVTYETFSCFLKTYLEIALCEITLNLLENQTSSFESDNLINKVFNIDNVADYHNWLCKKMRHIVEKNKEEEGFETMGDIRNEYIKDEQLLMFFEENKFLLKTLELRVHFYNKYSPNISHLPSVG